MNKVTRNDLLNRIEKIDHLSPLEQRQILMQQEEEVRTVNVPGQRPWLFGRVLQVRNDQLLSALRFALLEGKDARIIDGDSLLQEEDDVRLYSVGPFGSFIRVLVVKGKA